jgi:PHD/YefM family antitoxin component YafN of YafNO toxin-antitoxin module
MKTIDLEKASKPLSEYAKEIDKEILVLKSKDKPVAALVSLKDVDAESISLSTNPEFLEIIEKSRKEFKLGKRISLDEMKKEITKM